LVFLVRIVKSDRFLCIKLPMSCPLQVCDSCSAEVIVKFLGEQGYVPGFETLRDLFHLNIDFSTSDRGSANVKGENSMVADCIGVPRERFNFPCDAHMTSTAQGYGYKPIADTVSGVLATSLAQQVGGSVGKFRKEIVIIAIAQVRVYKCSPPPASAEQLHERDALLDLFLPDSCPAKRLRKEQLKVLLNSGNVEGSTIAWYCPEDNPNVEQWASAVAGAVFPHGITKFTRTRWLTSLEAIDEVGLLCNVQPGRQWGS
jgi:hypothetical protein